MTIDEAAQAAARPGTIAASLHHDGTAHALNLRGSRLSDLSDVDLLAAMLAIRGFEERVRDMRIGGQISGSVHLENGQEAIPVGALIALAETDAVFCTYRGHGWALASGSTFTSMFAELLGREGGVNGGRGGSAYLSDAAHHFYGENSIVGAGAPIACGAALSAKYDGSGRVALTVFGDGAMNQGSVSEAFNFAAALTLPVIFVCENNRYSELTLIADVVANERLHERAAPYGMPGVRIDGNDPRAVATAVATAADRARSGGGPTLIEAMTERLVGHYIGDAEQYRIIGEMDRIQADEPIERISRSLDTTPHAGDVGAMSDAITDLLRAAGDAALTQPLADERRVRDHLYATEPNRA
jgi:TPP-dependent pyruvate/acetoin dehydrogenase alpha subunit